MLYITTFTTLGRGFQIALPLMLYISTLMLYITTFTTLGRGFQIALPLMLYITTLMLYITTFTTLGRGFQIAFQDVAFMLSRVSFCITFLSNCGRGEGLETATCLKTVVGDKQEHAPCSIFSL